MKCTNKQQETCNVEKLGCDGCAYDEKTADEMFKECGFNKIDVIDKITGEKYPHSIEYMKWDGTWEEHIQFNDSTQLMTTSCELFGKATIGMIFYPELLQAINKKCQELRLERINIMEVKVIKEFELHTNHKAYEDDVFNLITILNDIDDYIFVLEKWGHIFMVHFGNEFVANEHLEFNYKQEKTVSAEVWITENESNRRIAECSKEKDKEIEYWKSKCLKLIEIV